MQAHMDDSNKYIKKPLIIQEFGKTLSQGRFEDKQGALIGTETATGDVGIRCAPRSGCRSRMCFQTDQGYCVPATG